MAVTQRESRPIIAAAAAASGRVAGINLIKIGLYRVR